MAVEVQEIEADSLEEARTRAEATRPQGRHLYLEEILSDGQPKSKRGLAESTIKAFENAKAELPAESDILEERELYKPLNTLSRVYADTQDKAREKLREEADDSILVGEPRLIRDAKEGFLGLGKKPPLYEADMKQLAVVEIRYRVKPKVRVVIERLPDRGWCQICGAEDAIFNEWNLPSVTIKGELINLNTRGYYTCSDVCRLLMLNLEHIDMAKLKRDLLKQMVVKAALGGNTLGFERFGRMSAREQRKVSYLEDELAGRIEGIHCWSCGQSLTLEAERCDGCGHSRVIAYEPKGSVIHETSDDATDEIHREQVNPQVQDISTARQWVRELAELCLYDAERIYTDYKPYGDPTASCPYSTSEIHRYVKHAPAIFALELAVEAREVTIDSSVILDRLRQCEGGDCLRCESCLKSALTAQDFKSREIIPDRLLGEPNDRMHFYDLYWAFETGQFEASPYSDWRMSSRAPFRIIIKRTVRRLLDDEAISHYAVAYALLQEAIILSVIDKKVEI